MVARRRTIQTSSRLMPRSHHGSDSKTRNARRVIDFEYDDSSDGSRRLSAATSASAASGLRLDGATYILIPLRAKSGEILPTIRGDWQRRIRVFFVSQPPFEAGNRAPRPTQDVLRVV
jgi:hypothetical protein